MRTPGLLLSCFSLFLAARILPAQTDPLAAIRDALTAKYSLTTATADKTDIVTPGAALTLKKSNLLAGGPAMPIVPSNTWKGGAITQGLMGRVAQGSSNVRTFVAGEKLWVTDIEARSKGVVFTLLSDPYSGVRYRATLTFPLAKGEIPSAATVAEQVGQVFAVEGDEQITANPPASATRNAEQSRAEPPPADNTPWDPRYGRLTPEQVAAANQPNIYLLLNYFRLVPSALDEKTTMQYFIALNNCNDSNIGRAIKNELDYPALADFYRRKAPQILAAMPAIAPDIAVDRYIGATPNPGNMVLWAKYLTLGEYDTRRKSFPINYPGKKGVELPAQLTLDSNNSLGSCPVANSIASLTLPTSYAVSITPAYFSELAMDQDAARKYIDATGPQRNVFLALDVALSDARPEVVRESQWRLNVTFHARAARIRVIDVKTTKPIGTLFDDHSMPAETAVAQAPPPPPPPAKPTNQWGFDDHMYDIRTSVYVSLAADACKWPLTAEQSANLSAFLQRVSHGNFSEREQYNLADARIRKGIVANGRENFCASPVERRSFKDLSQKIAPLGPMAAPAPK